MQRVKALQRVEAQAQAAVQPRGLQLEHLTVVAHGGRGAAPAAGAYTRPLLGSTKAHFVGYDGCMIFPQSSRQWDTGRCDQNGLG